ncbi:MAG: VOC family protein [Deltaproteobacteria bacterium]|nr:VOC family protein [Deltaproteobacteria bacterium]
MSHEQAGAQPIHHAIDYIELPVHDMAAARAFYAAAFGWRFNDYGPGYTGIVRPGGQGEAGGLRLQADHAGSRGGPLVILYSAEIDATEAAVRAAGGEVVVPIFAFPGGRRFAFLDPSGNELAVWTQP